MSIAYNLLRRFSLIPRHEDGMRDDDLLEGFRLTCEHLAASIVEECPDSYDSTREYTFNDDSVLRFANPRQRCYGAFVTMYENGEFKSA